MIMMKAHCNEDTQNENERVMQPSSVVRNLRKRTRSYSPTIDTTATPTSVHNTNDNINSNLVMKKNMSQQSRQTHTCNDPVECTTSDKKNLDLHHEETITNETDDQEDELYFLLEGDRTCSQDNAHNSTDNSIEHNETDTDQKDHTVNHQTTNGKQDPASWILQHIDMLYPKMQSNIKIRRRFPNLLKESEKEDQARHRRSVWTRLERLNLPLSCVSSDSSELSLNDTDVTNEESYYLRGQQEHVQRGLEILRNSPLLVDTSMMGDGKTYTTCFLARQLSVSYVVVVCPVAVQSKWKRMQSLHNVPIEYVTSYQSLRSGSTVGDDMSSRMVRKQNVENAQGKIVSYFEANSLFRSLVQQGVLLVLDEFHNAKNLSIQHKACRALVRNVLDQTAADGAPSRVVFLSGTPIDEMKHSVNMLRLMGILRHPQLVAGGTGVQTPRGLAEIVDFCLFIDPVATRNVLQDLHTSCLSADLAEKYAYLLFQQVVLGCAGISMPPQNRAEQIVCRNTYYTMDDNDSKALVENVENLGNVLRSAGVVELSSSLSSMPSTLTTHSSTQFIYGEISRTLMYIEYAKINVFCRAARHILGSNPTSKVVIFLNYLMNLDLVARHLESVGYRVLTMNGVMRRSERGCVLDAFQSYSLDHRILVTQLKVGSTGIDLDDKFGDRPRFAFASPNYNVIDLYQLTRRFHRVDTKSTAYVRFVYGNVAHHETRLLTALARKSEIMKETLSKQVDAGIQFPSDFPYEYD